MQGFKCKWKLRIKENVLGNKMPMAEEQVHNDRKGKKHRLICCNSLLTDTPAEAGNNFPLSSDCSAVSFPPWAAILKFRD